jgi:hypothetical protein
MFPKLQFLTHLITEAMRWHFGHTDLKNVKICIVFFLLNMIKMVISGSIKIIILGRYTIFLKK